MIKKIYLDMDGVITDFSGRYLQLFSQPPTESREKKEFHTHWATFVETRQFATLDWWPDGKELIEYIKTVKVEVEFLTSSGGLKYHDLVSSQKLEWLKSQGIPYKANIVAGRRLKSEYATPETILVDDTLDVIDSFVESGGIGIHHKKASDTINIISQLLKLG